MISTKIVFLSDSSKVPTPLLPPKVTPLVTKKHNESISEKKQGDSNTQTGEKDVLVGSIYYVHL